jgi:integrase
VDAGSLLARRGSGVAHCVYELLAFYVYSGARAAEVANAQVGDAHAHAARMEIRASKIRHGHVPVTRIIALPPALADALAAYTKRTGKIGGPLFETTLGNRVDDCQRAIDFVSERAGFGAGYFTTRMFRTAFATYYATVDGVSANVVRAARLPRGSRSPELSAAAARGEASASAPGRTDTPPGDHGLQVIDTAFDVWVCLVTSSM